MRIKLFRAATMAQAIAQLRLDLGPDALILSSQTGADGVELTAALEDEYAAPPAGPAIADDTPATPAAKTLLLETLAPETRALEKSAIPGIPAFSDDQSGGEAWCSSSESIQPLRPVPLRPVPLRPAQSQEPFVASDTRWPPLRPSRPGLAPGWQRPPPMAPQFQNGDGNGDEQRRHAALTWHGVPETIARRLSTGPLPSALAAAFRFASLDTSAGASPLFMVGPSGAGKTMTTARLAARLVIQGAHPLVITSDGDRAGAAEQLAAFTRLLGLELFIARKPAALAHAVRRRERGEPVLIDSAGADPFDRFQAEHIAELAEAAGAVSVLVLPSGLDAAEAGDLASGFRAAGASLLVANRIDVYRRLGGVLAAADTGLAFAEAGVGPGAADGLTTLSPAFLADRLLQLPDRAT